MRHDVACSSYVIPTDVEDESLCVFRYFDQQFWLMLLDEIIKLG
jgi:hypothetical protein